MGMPDGNTAALRLYELEQEQAVRMYDHAAALAEAREQIQDADGLKKILNDEFLAADLADCFANIENAIADMAEALGRVRLPHVEIILNRIARMERAVFNIAMEE